MADEAKLREYLKRATADLRKTRRRLRAVEARGHEPLAIVGMGCRYPGGVRSPQDLWELIVAERDAIAPFPIDRGWDLGALYDPDLASPGTSYVREGGFIEDVGHFDAGFFGISPREALAMDPQQRLLLETSWEALEDARIDPSALRGSPTGVFTGIAQSAYGTGRWGSSKELQGYWLTGGTTSVASGRVAYALGLEGPAISVDTACSASLVALHLACQALRRGECSLALAGGACVMVGPGVFMELSQQRALAPDGRCKSFAQAADGTGWGEGVGVLALERLEDARRHGRRVLAVVRGSAVNQDGASNGLTAPNGASQQRVIHQALLDAGLTERDVDAVEAHGTGTALGDPIEAQALLATYGRGREPGRPLRLGSIKSNIGHTQTAAGVAGVIKMVMALRHGMLPKTLHVDEPSHEVDWSAGSVSLLSESTPWRSDGGATELGPRRAGISSFGISGTNAHVIVEEAPPRDAGAGEPPAIDALDGALEVAAVPWVLSGHSRSALRDQALRLAAHVGADGELGALDVGRSLLSRQVFEHRAVVLGGKRESLLEGLGEIARGASGLSVREGTAMADGEGGAVFVFPGQGSQWWGMAGELLDRSPVFAGEVHACAEALAPFVEWSLEDVLRGVGDAALLERVDVVSPALFAVMVSLAALWQACGVRPGAVVGHSQGEIAAAYVAGGLSLGDAARLVAVRARLLQSISGAGAVVSVAAAEEDVRARVARWEGRLAVAAVNGPGVVAVSGEPAALAGLREECEAQGVRTREVAMGYAAHSPQVEVLREQLLEVCAAIAPRSGEVPFYSTVTGGPLDTASLDGEYWYRNLRETVRFAGAVRGLLERGYRRFVEISPHPVLTIGVQEAADRFLAEEPGARLDEVQVAAVGSLQRGEGGPRRFVLSLAELWTSGGGVDWEAIFRGSGGKRVGLPTYAFQRERFWLDPVTGGARDRAGTSEPDWCYRVAWKRVEEPAGQPRGVWLALLAAGAPRDRQVVEVIGALEGCGVRVVQVEVDGASADRGELAQRLRAALETAGAGGEADGAGGEAEGLDGSVGGLRVDGAVSLLALDERPHESCAALPAGLAGTVALVQALGDAGVEGRLWLLSRGAVQAGAEDPVCSPAQAMTWGLGRTLALEQPERWGGLVDLPSTLEERSLRGLCGLLAGDGVEDQLALRAAGAFAPRLVHAPAWTGEGLAWKPHGTVLITGGTGGLGGHFARRLAREGAEHLLLTSRRGPAAPGAAELVEELKGLGAEASVVACDVSDREQVRELLACVPEEHPLDTVMHAAGVASPCALDELTVAGLAQTLAAKVGGATHLHELTEGMELSAFVLCSSLAATMGSRGQGDYAAANAFLDGLAEHRRALDLAGTSIAWGLWGGVSWAAKGGEIRRRGVLEMEPERALDELQRALDHGERCVTVARIDWDRYAPLYTVARSRPLIGDLQEVRLVLERAAAERGEDARGQFAARLAGLSERERERVALELVCSRAAEILGHAQAGEVQAQRTFRDHGFDSLMAVQMRDRLQRVTGLRLSSTVVFDHPTPAALARLLVGEALGAPRATAPRLPARAEAGEPIAIVGMGCRYPGIGGSIGSPQELWELVESGADAISGFPTDRGWDLEGLYRGSDRAEASRTREGGFLHDVAEFDAAFFGISPREALAMDPQQRLMLEVSWEAIEHAGIPAPVLRGSETGVFAGINPPGYGLQLPEELEGYQVTGPAGSVVSGRVAYTLGLEGPAVSVDTACSSSLVALHLACASLRAGECSLALAGGVAIMPTPSAFVAFSRQGGLAADGRCKSFADAADGAGWSEGAGVVVLERLADAQRNGRRIMALIRGSAVNQDGASNGLTAPNGLAQQRVIRRALADAGVAAAQVDVVEGHGTGTVLGDPIEAQALLETYGSERPAGRPLWLGSIKSNLGHPAAAAGVAGVIKIVMSLRREALPRTLHVDVPSTRVDWREGAVSLLVEQQPWPRREEPRRAGVSSFGVSGTNAHLILEEAPPEQLLADGEGSSPQPRALPLLVSGRGEAALRAQARRLLERLERDPAIGVADVGYALAVSRAQLEDRAVVYAEGRAEALEGLAALARGEEAVDVVRGVARAGEQQLAFLFTGQGAQRVGMGRELHAAFPVFASALEEVCGLLEGLLAHPLRELLLGEPSAEEERAAAGRLEDTMLAQAGLFALELALFRLLEDWGVRPDHLLGHSIGELAAAHVAGVFSLEDACRLVAARGRLMSELPRGGAMVALQASEEELGEALAGMRGRVELAAVNGPSAVVLSGDEEAVLELVGVWEARGRRTRRLRVSHAFHSPRMEGMLERFAEVTRSVAFAAPQIPLVSNLTGREATEQQLCDPAYWVRHVREPVRFGDGVRRLHELGVSSFLELGPDGVLSAMCREGLADEDDTRPIVAVSALRRGRPEARTLTRALADLWVGGVEVDWRRAFDVPEGCTAAGVAARGARQECPAELPTYAFQRRRYWLATPAGGLAPSAADRGSWGPLIESAVELADGRGWLFTGGLSVATQPWLADHVVMGFVLVPGTTFVDLALSLARQLGCEAVQELVMESTLVLAEGESVWLQVAVGELDALGCRTIAIHSRPRDRGEGDLSGEQEGWRRHASGTLAVELQDPPEELAASNGHRNGAGEWPPPGAEAVPVEDLYGRLAGAGVEYGPAFFGVRALWRRGEELFCEVRLPESERARASTFTMHPALFDAVLHAGVMTEREFPQMEIPFAWNGVRIDVPGSCALRVRVAPTPDKGRALSASDEHGTPVLAVQTLHTRPVFSEQLARARGEQLADGLLALRWSAVPLPAASALAPGLVLADCAAEDPADPHDLPQAAHRVTHRALERVQQWLLEGRAGAQSRLVLLTHGAVALGAREESAGLAQAPVWGLVRSAQAEHPGRFLLVDLDEDPTSRAALPAALMAALAMEEPQLALRKGEMLVPRLVEAGEEIAAADEPWLDPERTLLLTGATSGLGALLARHLVANRGVRRLLLVSRRGRDAAGAAELDAELTAQGAHVEIAACDVADRGRLEELLGGVDPEHPLGAVVHAAGVLDDGVIDFLDAERVDRVLAPKVDGAWHLHELTERLDLSRFVLFSSAAGVLGNPGQGNYAAANAFLDALAAYRRARGLPATALAWGPWAQTGGMTAALQDADDARIARTGAAGLSNEEGLELFDLARAREEALLVPLRLERAALRAQARAGALPALLRGLVRVSAPGARAAEEGSLARELAAAPVHDRERIVLHAVRAHTAIVLGHPSAGAIEAQQTFKELGFDSLAAIELRNRLNVAAGLRLPATLVFDHPTPAALAERVLSEVRVAETDGAVALDAELDRVEGLLAFAGEGEDRERARARLRRMLADIEEEEAPGADGVAQRVQSATVAEVLEFIDSELGGG